MSNHPPKIATTARSAGDLLLRQLPKLFRSLVVLFFVVVMAPVASAQLGGLLSRRTKVPIISIEKVRQLQTNFDTEVQRAKRFGTEAPEPTFIIVDVRSADETEVSVIPGAITSKMYEANQDKYAEKEVIAYCTTGYRSSQFASKLIDRGIRAKNMKRSILGWCADRLPLQTLDRKNTKRVHTYSSKNKVPESYEQVW